MLAEISKTESGNTGLVKLFYKVAQTLKEKIRNF